MGVGSSKWVFPHCPVRSLETGEEGASRGEYKSERRSGTLGSVRLQISRQASRLQGGFSARLDYNSAGDTCTDRESVSKRTTEGARWRMERAR
eukprot:764987-Hanusia_phi.AAC.13